MRQIYLDNAATTHLDPQVLEAMLPFFQHTAGNASALHRCGVTAAKGIEQARAQIAQSLNAQPEEIFFTSGGTEANNLALKGAAFAAQERGNHLITSNVEHPSVLQTCRWLATKGFELTVVPVNAEGLLTAGQVRQALRKDTILVSVMQVNNEIGTLQPVKAIGELCRKRGIYFHSDACQGFTKVSLDVKAQNLDLVTLNAHKVHGPLGVGALYIRKGITMEAQMHGGAQEQGLRSGTINTPGIVGFGKAAALEDSEAVRGMTELRDYFIKLVESRIPGARLNGSRDRRICNNINFSFGAGVAGKSLMLELDKRGITVSSGSACSARSLKPSKVLLAIGLSEAEAHSAIRFSLSKWTTRQEMELTAQILEEIVRNLRGANA
jgi:cysteine desulfurase